MAVVDSQWNLVVIARSEEADLSVSLERLTGAISAAYFLDHTGQSPRGVGSSREAKNIQLVPGPVEVHEVLVSIADELLKVPDYQLMDQMIFSVQYECH